MAPSLQIHVQRRPLADRDPSSTSTASSPTVDSLRSRVREALCCPYCHESLRPEELSAQPTQQAASYSTAADVAGLAALSGASLLANLAQPSSVLLSTVLLATSLAVPTFLVLRNLGAFALASTGAGELVREAWNLALRRGTDTSSAGSKALSCARPGCGATYHAECWKECTTSYGACAVFACGSREARNLSQTQVRLRALRLLLAAFLFSQRLIDSVKNSESDSNDVARMRRAIRTRASRLHDVMWAENVPHSGPLRVLASLVQLTVAFAGVALGFWLGLRSNSFGSSYLLVCGLGVPMSLALALYGSTWVAALGLYAAKSLLSSEFSALTRLGQRGAFLSRAKSKK